MPQFVLKYIYNNNIKEVIVVSKYFDEKVGVLLVLCLIYAFFSVLVYNLTDKYIHYAMIWNLILAILPLFLSIILKIRLVEKSKILIFVFGTLWLLFFPNAPYMITDFIHISTIRFYTSGQFNIISWVRLIHIGLGFLLGITVGMISLYNIHQSMLKFKNKMTVNVALVVISLLSGYAIYIGRLLRFNSWDVLRPIVLLKTLIKNINTFSFSCTLLFAFYILFTYFIFYLLLDNKNKK